jgi:hypothetical protein
MASLLMQDEVGRLLRITEKRGKRKKNENENLK